jgi:hypothetical protein
VEAVYCDVGAGQIKFPSLSSGKEQELKVDGEISLWEKDKDGNGGKRASNFGFIQL